MQTLTEIRELLESAGLAPAKRFGQHFLIDGNLMRALLGAAELSGTETVLEVGPGTGSLTEELLARTARVVAVEIDRGMYALLSERLGGCEDLTLLHADALSGKHAIEPAVLAATGPTAHLVSNLPYNIATPLVAQCLIDSWRVACGHGGQGLSRFDRLTFTVQREVADRFSAGPGTSTYGPVSVLIALLGHITPGPIVPASAFWPRPKVESRIVRIDFDAAVAANVQDIDRLDTVLRATFGHRRKQAATALRRAGLESGESLAAAGIDPTWRAQRIAPEQFRLLAQARA